MAPINTVGGFRLWRRSFGYHYAPGQTQRTIGQHVYIFQPTTRGLTVWRLDLADETRGDRWTLLHECWCWGSSASAPPAAEQLALRVAA
jgi:hypothetical protein